MHCLSAWPMVRLHLCLSNWRERARGTPQGRSSEPGVLSFSFNSFHPIADFPLFSLLPDEPMRVGDFVE